MKDTRLPTPKINDKILISFSLPNGEVCSYLTAPNRHRIWEALEAANQALHRPATRNEVTDFLIAHECLQLTPSALKLTKGAVTTALKHFVVRGLAFSRKEYTTVFFGSRQLLNENTAMPRDGLLSFRGIVLATVTERVNKLQRAVSCAEVKNHLRVQKTKINYDGVLGTLWSLVGTEHLKTIKTDGNNIYAQTYFLPTHLEVVEFSPAVADHQSHLKNIVYQTVKQICFEKKELAARGKQDDVKLLTTAEILKRVKSLPEFQSLPHQNKWGITYTLKILANGRTAFLQRVVQENGKSLWWVAGEEVAAAENTYTSDSMRMTAAVRRAYRKNGNLPVTLTAIKKEIAADKSLRLTGKLTVSQCINSLAHRDLLSKNEKLKKFKFTCFVRRIGSVKHTAFYTPGKVNLLKARAFVFLKQLENEWTEIMRCENLSQIEAARLPSVKVGRCFLFQQVIGEFSQKIKSIRTTYLAMQFDALQEKVAFLLQSINEYKRQLDAAALPATVETSLVGLLGSETLQLLAPFSSTFAQMRLTKSPQRETVQRLLYAIRRIPNPNYIDFRLKCERSAAKFMFEKTDALFYLARKAGGAECRFQAAIAKPELGAALRDARFIIPALTSPHYEERQTAIACLAFLQKETALLKKLALADSFVDNRIAALWAYAFAGGADYQQIALERAKVDIDEKVRNFAFRLAETPPAEIIRL